MPPSIKDAAVLRETLLRVLAQGPATWPAWLVSALAAQMVEGEHDRTAPLTATHAAGAAERLLASHTAHLAELAAHLRDPRVRRALASVTAGRPLSGMTDDDLRYARDLGLVARDWPLRIANAMYKKLVATTSG